MLSLQLATQLKTAGLTWDPTAGDRFVLPIETMEDEVFILSNVIADVHSFEGGNVIGFNGTTEWALDSVEQDDVVWLPREDHRRYVDIEAERAYARAVLARLTVPQG